MPRIIEGDRQNVIGGNIRKYRKMAKMSQKNLSERLEGEAIYICRGSISRIESGERMVTDIEIIGLAKALGVEVLDLFDGLIEKT